jgi:RimJ/RimL family protein N-acetyltransferase
MVEIVPYRAEHSSSIKVRDVDPLLVERLGPDYFMHLEKTGFGYTLLVDGEVVGSAVFSALLYPGVYEAVVIGGELMAKYGRMVHRVVTSCIDDVQQFHGIRRLQAMIDARLERNVRWAERLGFETEGIARSFGPHGEDYVMMARVREDMSWHF